MSMFEELYVIDKYMSLLCLAVIANCKSNEIFLAFEYTLKSMIVFCINDRFSLCQ